MKPIIEIIKETEPFISINEDLQRRKVANLDEFLPGIGDFISEYAQKARKTPISRDVSEREHKNSSEKLYSNE